jgi:hypothetical protein
MIEKIKVDKDVLGGDILVMQSELGELLVVPVKSGAITELERYFASQKSGIDAPVTKPPTTPAAATNQQ